MSSGLNKFCSVICVSEWILKIGQYLKLQHNLFTFIIELV